MRERGTPGETRDRPEAGPENSIAPNGRGWADLGLSGGLAELWTKAGTGAPMRPEQ